MGAEVERDQRCRPSRGILAAAAGYQLEVAAVAAPEHRNAAVAGPGRQRSS
jgi:hypothetical protein